MSILSESDKQELQKVMKEEMDDDVTVALFTKSQSPIVVPGQSPGAPEAAKGAASFKNFLLESIREVSTDVAVSVARVAYDEGLAPGPVPDDLAERIRSMMYEPNYREYA